MKKSNLLLLAALSGVLFLGSCKKKTDDPAPVVVTPTGNSGSGTFMVNGEVQTPTVYSKKTFESLPYMTQIIAQNSKYQIKLEFDKKPLVNGQYTVANAFSEGMTVSITVMDMVTNDTDLITSSTEKVTVMDDKITFSGIKGELNDKAITMSADITVK